MFEQDQLAQMILAHAKVARALCGYPDQPIIARAEPLADTDQQSCVDVKVCQCLIDVFYWCVALLSSLNGMTVHSCKDWGFSLAAYGHNQAY